MLTLWGSYGPPGSDGTFAFPSRNFPFLQSLLGQSPLTRYCNTAFPAAAHLWNPETTLALATRSVPAFLQRWACFHRDVSKQHCNFVLYNFNQDSPSAYSRVLLPTASHSALPTASHYCMYHLNHVIYCKRECWYGAQRSTVTSSPLHREPTAKHQCLKTQGKPRAYT